jgi:5-methylcytosine-specific restriction endonuclease McrA
MTDIGTTARKRLSRRDRLAIWEAHGGVCVTCGLKIDGARERWIVEHVRALELGGTNDTANLGPAHERCGIEKTKDDHSRAGKAKAVKAKHLGIKKAKRPFRGWRGFDGRLIRNPHARMNT